MRFYPRKRNISLQSEQIGGIDMFQGFSQQTNDFLWGIRFNNERSWFEAHKQEYLDYVQSPLRQLAQEVYARFSAAHEELPLMVDRKSVV